MAEFNLEIITPQRVFYKNKVELVQLKGAYGNFEILPRHENFVSVVMPDVIKILSKDGEKHAFVSMGTVKVNGDTTTIVVDSAEWPEEIDAARAQEAEKRAKERLSSNSVDVARAELALKRAIGRLRTISYK